MGEEEEAMGKEEGTNTGGGLKMDIIIVFVSCFHLLIFSLDYMTYRDLQRRLKKERLLKQLNVKG